MRLLTLEIREPLPGLVLPAMAAEHGEEEAARRYKAIVITTLRQLRGLQDARLRLLTEPVDAQDAVRFWLLPRLAEQWDHDEAVFRTVGWEIDFGGTAEMFSIEAVGEILCPNLGARWVHAALLGLGRTTHCVVGPSRCGGEYLRATTEEFLGSEPRILPELPIIRTGNDWIEALDSPIGAALKKAWEDEGY